MGAQVSVVNDTPYTWHYATQDRGVRTSAFTTSDYLWNYVF